MDLLYSYAQTTLGKNIVTTNQGPFLRAGLRQFSSLWSRDFLYAVPGLLKINRADVVKNHIQYLVSSSDKEGLIPRILAHQSSAPLVVKWTVLKPIWDFIQPEGESNNWTSYPQLKPEIYGEHGTRSLDSGLLLLIRYLENRELFRDSENKFQKVFSYYQKITNDCTELMSQFNYEDWQDSAKRSGKISYCNLLFLIILKKLNALQIGWTKDPTVFEKKFFDLFLQDSLIFVDGNKRQISLETQLHFLEQAHWMLANGDSSWESLAQANWKQLRKSELWNKKLGIPVSPFYSSQDISLFTKAVGLRHYHDNFRWTWLLAESAKICVLYKDTNQAEKILNHLQSACKKTASVPEIFNLDFQLHESLFYKSETGFSWGAGKCIEALSLI